MFALYLRDPAREFNKTICLQEFADLNRAIDQAFKFIAVCNDASCSVWIECNGTILRLMN